MRKVIFEQDEYLVMAMFDTGNCQQTMEKVQESLPYIKDDEELHKLVIETIEKMKRLSEEEYRAIDLEPYKQDGEADE